MDLEHIKELFPIFQSQLTGSCIYFDSAATSQKPECVIEAMDTFYRSSYGTVHRALYDLSSKATESYENIRRKVQQFINAKSPSEIIFTRGTTQSLNMIARCFCEKFLTCGDEILITEAEHHANIVPWQRLVQKLGIKLKWIPVDDNGDIHVSDIEKLVTYNTKLISVAMMTNTTGTIYPITEIVQIAKRVGARVSIDAAQALTFCDIDVEKLDVDFLAFSGHKMYGPSGIGVLFAKQELLEQMDPYEFGGDMVESVSFEQASFQKPPLKFEAGTPMIAEVIGLGAALDFLKSIGLDNLRNHGTLLHEYMLKKLQAIPGIRIIGLAKRKGPIITFFHEDVHAMDLGVMLSLENIALRTGKLCAEPILFKWKTSAVMRVSFGVYNTKKEIDVFIERLLVSLETLSGKNLLEVE